MLLYRSIWTEDRERLDAVLWDAANRWIGAKHRIELPERGTVTAGNATVDVRRADAEVGRVLRITLRETDPAQRVWTTTATALEDSDRLLWVDVDCHDPRARHLEIAAPNLVVDLISNGAHPRQGSTILTTTAQAVRPEEAAALAASIRDPNRYTPVVVFSHDAHVPAAHSVKRGLRAAKTLAGLGRVLLLPPETINPFVDAMGRDLAVWGGAVRVYRPGWREDEDPSRHVVIAPRRFTGGFANAGKIVAQRLAASMTPDLQPMAWRRLRPLLARPGEDELAAARRHWAGEARDRVARDRANDSTVDVADLNRQNAKLTELLAVAEAERAAVVDDLEAENSRLRGRVSELTDLWLDALGELEDTTLERERESARAARLQAVLNRTQVTGDDWEQATLDTEAESVEVQTPSEAIDAARRLLDRVVIPDAACRQLDRLDTVVEARSWASTTWRGLLALQRYAEAVAGGFGGGFWQWCADNGLWPATPKRSPAGSAAGSGNGARTTACGRQHRRSLPCPSPSRL